MTDEQAEIARLRGDLEAAEIGLKAGEEEIARLKRERNEEHWKATWYEAHIEDCRRSVDYWKAHYEKQRESAVKAEQEYADLFANTSDLLKRFREYCESNPPFAKRNKPEGVSR